MANTDALKRYLEQVRLIHGSNLDTNERSYYPALDTLFNAIGETLSPQVLAIHDVEDVGAGHPDFALQVTTNKNLRAVVEVKGIAAKVDEVAASEQVRRYLKHYGLCLVTNLRDFKLVRLGSGGQIEEVMRQRIGETDAHFWREPVEALLKRYGDEMMDFLTSVLLWDAEIARPKDLADALARYARAARREMERRSDAGLEPLRKALAEALGLHFTDDQGVHFFRSSLVQTLFYGLFSAWVAWNRDHPGAPPESFRWREAGDYLHLPVLRELFEHVAIPSQLEGLHIRRPIEWAEATLRRTIYGNFASVFSDGSAVNYFYEPFLEAYDPELREQLGVWYTPREIIQYQVARVDRLLRDELDIADGLADDRVIVLDPATGTGGYLLEVLRVIDRTLRETDDATRGMRLRRAATSRVFGFEILPAPFVVAHLQIASLLATLGGTLGEKDRPGVYLTNALTGWTEQEYAQGSFDGWPALKKEVEAAADVKQRARILVVIGNPPYFVDGVAADEERALLEPYYQGLKKFGVQARTISDLYVRFFRLAERQIAETTKRGIVSYITNYSWLTGMSHPAMRKSLLEAFDTIWIDSLNGDKYRTGKRTPWGTSDQSIFTTDHDPRGIQVGTAVATLVRKPNHGQATVYWRQFWGKADEKREAMLAGLTNSSAAPEYETISPALETRFKLTPGGLDADYLVWLPLPRLFPTHFPGFKTSRDADLVSVDAVPLRERMRMYYDSSVSDTQVAAIAPTLLESTDSYKAREVRAELLKSSEYDEARLARVAYRPLDERWLYWEDRSKLLDRSRPEFREQATDGNLFLVANASFRRNGAHTYLADKFVCLDMVDRGASCFPLFLHNPNSLWDGGARIPNISPELVQLYGEWQVEPAHLAQSVFFHALAIIRCPLYYEENEAYLKQDWPRIPLPASRERLEASAALGKRVGDLLRPDVPFTPSAEERALALPRHKDGGQLSDDDLRVTVRYNGVGRYEPPVTEGGVERPARLWWNDVAYWENVPPAVWSFTIGGYPVVKKWLDYRHIEKLKRPLALDEVRYVAEMVRRIAALLALGPALDANYAAVKADTLALNAATVGAMAAGTADE